MKLSPAILYLPMAALSLLGCHRDMYEQPKYLPEKPNYYFPSEEVDRLPVAHTVPRGPIEDHSTFYTGMTGNGLATAFPYPMTSDIVQHGREVFEINCSECHGRDGYGKGMIVQRGFPAPPSFHADRLRDAPVGHFFNVITAGYGAMYPFGSRIGPADRWAIIGYIRALQFSQDAPASVLSGEDRAELEKAK
jgi:mono/diheme cytochrome c family protein